MHRRRGTLPLYCPGCKPSSHRKRDARSAAARGDVQEARALLAPMGLGAASELPPTLKAARLAIALWAHPEIEAAAQLAELEERGAKLKRLRRLAEKHWPHLIEDPVSHLPRLTSAFMCVNALLSAFEAGRLPPTQRAQANQRAAQTIAQLHDASAASYAGPVRVEWIEEDVE